MGSEMCIRDRCTLRVAGHDMMDYHKNATSETGGLDGCFDSLNGDNRGLYGCMVHHKVAPGFEDNYATMYTPFQAHCTEVSFADFTVIASEALMAAASPPILALGSAATPQDVRGLCTARARLPPSVPRRTHGR